MIDCDQKLVSLSPLSVAGGFISVSVCRRIGNHRRCGTLKKSLHKAGYSEKLRCTLPCLI